LGGREKIYLAISDGGAKGDSGVGILLDWTAAGTRPEFTQVTGISVGALIALVAFLGPDYDERLKEAVTSITTRDIAIERSSLGTLNSDAADDSTPLKNHIAKYFGQKVIDAISRERHKGRRLFIATTNLDANRGVLWNIGEIAATLRPDAGNLIRSVLLSSASIPGAFPPKYIQVETGGQLYDEIHVDGGAMAQVFLYPMGIDWRVVKKKLKVKGIPRGYIIHNSRLCSEWVSVNPPKTLKIVGRAFNSLIGTQGIGEPLFRPHLLDEIDAVCDSRRIPPLESLNTCFNNFRSIAICVIAYISDFKWQTPGLLLSLKLPPMSLHNYRYN
jgi:hypothetical protein